MSLISLKIQYAFPLQHINGRMYGYENMTSTARLRQYLAAKGGYLATSDFIANRMEELKPLTWFQCRI